MLTTDSQFDLKQLFQQNKKQAAFDNLTYEKWLDEIFATIEWLKHQNIKRTQQVAIELDNCHQIITLIIALWELQAIPLLLPPRMVLPAEIKKISQIPQLNSTTNQFSLTFPLNQTAMIIFTSGTTNKAKAVELTIGNIYYSALGSNQYFKLKSEDRWKITLPMNRIAGVMIPFRTMLAGANSVTAGHADFYSLVPAQIDSMQEELKKAKAALVGGGPIPSHYHLFCKENSIPLYTSYGMSEMASTIAIGKDEWVEILPYRDLIIDQGHIAVGGRCLFKGYLDGSKPFDQKGYFYTGDLGTIGPTGLKVQGRSDSIFISGGINVDPHLIESLLKEINNINQAIVVPVNDSKWGQVGIAFIKSSKNLDEIEIRKQLNIKIHPHYHPKAFYPYSNETRSQLQQKAQALWPVH